MIVDNIMAAVRIKDSDLNIGSGRRLSNREHCFVGLPFVKKEYRYDIPLSFGDKRECLEPLRIRAEMKRGIQDLAAIYGS